MSLTRTGHTYRGLALLFLLVVCADLACPPPSCRGGEPPAGSHTLASARECAGGQNNSPASVAAPDGSERDERQPPAPCCGDDCFCCGHATAGASGKEFAALDKRSPYGASVAVSLPSPPLRSTFHPPRVS